MTTQSEGASDLVYLEKYLEKYVLISQSGYAESIWFEHTSLRIDTQQYQWYSVSIEFAVINTLNLCNYFKFSFEMM